MKVLVPVKRVVDYNVKVRVKADGSGVETANVKMSMNPFDEIAVEEAVRLKESGAATEIVVVSVGSTQSQETLRTALAIGADRAILVETAVETQPLAVAKILKAIVDKEQPGLVIMADPQVFLTAAQKLGAPPAECVVFEDAHVGIAAARAAGMKVIALATTHPADTLRDADLVIGDLRKLSLVMVSGLFAAERF